MDKDRGREIADGGKGPGLGESGGGAYPNPHSGKEPKGGGLMGHGGQSEIDYSGPDNPNSTTSNEDEDGAERPAR